MTDQPSPPTCELCQRVGVKLTRHHLIPRKRHRRRSATQRFERDEMRSRIALLCQPCHSTIHATLSEQELEQAYNTIDTLANHPEIARFIQWVSKQHATRRIIVKRPLR